MDLSFLENVYVKGALTGALAAAAVDIAAFRSWKSINEALEYEWSIAIFRWGQGAVVGFLTAAGIAGVA